MTAQKHACRREERLPQSEPAAMTVDTLTPAHISRELTASYVGGSTLHRLFLKLRPFICPFEEVLRRVPAGARVLDVGCGIGYLSNLVAGHCAPAAVIGIDVDVTAVRLAQENRKDMQRVRFEQMEPNTFPSGPFDLILCVDVLHHVPPADQQNWIGALVQLLAPNGILLLKDISTRPLWKRCMNQLHDLVMAKQWVHPRNEQEVCTWLAPHSGKIIERVRCDRLWYPHYLIRWQKS